MCTTRFSVRSANSVVDLLERARATKQGGKALQLVYLHIPHRSQASDLDGSRSIDHRTRGDSNAAQVKPDKRPSERERRGKLAYSILRVPKSEKRVKQKEAGRIRSRCQLISHEIIDKHRAEAVTSPGCPSRTEPSRKVASGTVLHDDTLLSIAIFQQFVKRDYVRVGQMLKKIDLGIDQLGEHSLVIHSQFERLRSEHLLSSARTRSSEAVSAIRAEVFLVCESIQRRRRYSPIGIGYLDVPERLPFASQGVQPRILLHPNV